MRDVVKTNVKREENRKRKRRRKRHTPFYLFLVILMVISIGVLLSVTLLFNVKNIVVKGDVDYKNEDIIRMSGISSGDNLVRLDSQKAADRILSSMIYIENAEINKQYPGTLVINVSRCISTANIECDDGYLVISEKGKILDKVKEQSDDLILIKGFESSNDILGTYIKSNDEQKDIIVQEILDLTSKDEKHKITAVDMTDKYDININYGNRITFDMGNSNDISYKLNLAGTVLDKIGDEQKGTMTMVGTNQISFREAGSNKKTESGNNKIPVNLEDMPSTEATDSQSSDDLADEEAYDENYNNNAYSEDGYNEDVYNEDQVSEEDYYYEDQNEYYDEGGADEEPAVE